MKLMINSKSTFDEIAVKGMPKLGRYVCSFVLAVNTQLLRKKSNEMTLCALKRHKTKNESNLAFLFSTCVESIIFHSTEH